MVKREWWMVLAMLPLSSIAQGSETGKPVVKVGDVAVYTVNLKRDNRTVEETVTITSVDGAQIKSTHARPNRTTEGISTAEWGTVVSSNSGSRFDPPIQTLKFPLSVGDSWASVYETTGADQSRSKTDLRFKVVANEKLTTPAGDFDTFRIDSGGWVTGITWSGAVRVAQTQWYAPSISRYVKTEYKDFRNGELRSDTATELKSFKPAP